MKRKNIKLKILHYFFENPTQKLRVRQIERKVGVALPSVIQYVKELTREDILRKEDFAGVVMYSAKRTSQKFLFEKRIHNMKILVNSGLVNYIIEKLSNPNIILFGSFSKGEDTEESDIDLYIETPSKSKISLTAFEKKLDRSIQIFTYSKIHKIKNKELANNIINGITLNGFIEVHR